MRRRLFILLALLLACSACQRVAEPQQTLLLATIPPLGYILEEVAGDSATVEVLLPAGASPHAFEPRPSDARRAQQAVALVYVSDELDGWAARLDCSRRIALLDLVPTTMAPTTRTSGPIRCWSGSCCRSWRGCSASLTPTVPPPMSRAPRPSPPSWRSWTARCGRGWSRILAAR